MAESKSAAFEAYRIDIDQPINLKLQAQFRNPAAKSSRFHVADGAQPY
jgi:hypothetical protein